MKASGLRVNNTSNGQKPLNDIPNMQPVLVTKAKLNFSLGSSFPPPGTTAKVKYFFKLSITFFLKDATLFHFSNEQRWMVRQSVMNEF